MRCAVYRKNGWGGRSRTHTYGTRNRCPAIRRHPIGLPMRVFAFMRDASASENITGLASIRQPLYQNFFEKFD